MQTGASTSVQAFVALIITHLTHPRCPYVQATADGGCAHGLLLTPLTEAGNVGATMVMVKPK